LVSNRVERRLAAIFAGDVVGYSRLMGLDEEGTLARLNAHRRELIDPKIAEHRGRIVKTTGDGILIEFASVVDAARCAVEIQRAMPVRNADLPEDKRIAFRIGLNTGDIIIEGSDIFGDGVNIAARLESIAEPGGICLSEDAYRQLRGKLEIVFEDGGEQQLKNIAEPIRVYRIKLDGTAAAAAAPPLALPDKPSLAVLAFQNMSGDAEQDYFADGIVEDIITALARIKWLFVIARNSSFVYKGRSVDVRQVGRELGVRYVLEGSVRKAGNRLRITAQLLDAETGAHLWADRYDGALQDVFDLQDQITENVVGVVEPSLRQSEIARSRQKRPENLDAYDLYLRALPHMTSLMPEDAKIAAGFLEGALKLDPNYAAAHALLAWSHEQRFMRGGYSEADKAAGLRHARAAIVSSTDDATALAIAALVISHLDKDHETALTAIQRALALNPSSATALYFGAHIYAFSGDAPAAIAHAERALRLSPFDPWAYEGYEALGVAATLEGRDADAASYAAKAVQANPGFSTIYAFLVAALALAGRGEEAKAAARRLLELEPGFRSHVVFELGIQPALAERIVGGLRQMGLPE
jgi:TolB-like protein/class 3 adenylate cyclase/Tfp pilus assembly protein PilF